MEYSSLILGVLFILVCFNVGESVTKKLLFKKIYLLIIILAMFICSFIAPISISDWQISISGFIIPFFISVYYLFKVGSLYSYLKVGVAILLVTTLTLIYNIISFESFEYAYFQPYIFLAIVLGITAFFIAKTATNTFVALFLGYTLASVIHYLTKGIENYQMINLGGEQMLAMLVTSFASSLFGYYISRKIKQIRRRRAKNKDEDSLQEQT